MYTLADLKAELRSIIFPSGEATNLVAAHNKFFLDALIDLQQWVPCLQYDNTSLVPQCATFYNCGLTVFQAPRGKILRVSVIDKINPTTHLEDATADDDWCSEVAYRQVDFCHVRDFLHRAVRGSCCNIPLFFGLGCRKGRFPTPTDAGITGLPTLPLGYHYGQTSTDDKLGRAGSGVWAIDRGKIHIAPWLQSTETAIVKWDGIKRAWSDSDPIDEDPLLKLAVEEYVRWQHAAKYDRDEIEAVRAKGDYFIARQNLIHQCREETRVRSCESSQARATGTASGETTTPLFFNDRQQATASCPTGQTGDSITVTIAAGTVASNVSVADANAKALNEAQQQANAQLDCQSSAPTFTNDAQSFTAQCETSESGAPAPDGSPVTVTIPAGTVTSKLSKADANAKALAAAQQQATAQLKCTFWNASQTYQATCPHDEIGGPSSATVAAHTYSSTLSQADADEQALSAAKLQAESALSCSGGTLYANTSQTQEAVRLFCQRPQGGLPCTVSVLVTVAAGRFASLISQADANNQAIQAAITRANALADRYCSLGQCGTHNANY